MQLLHDTKALDVNQNSKEENDPIIQYDYMGKDNQQWIFERAR